MYLSVGVVAAIALVILSPMVWVAWWALADLGEHGTGSYRTGHYLNPAGSRPSAA
ncbi:MAG TPA: hypothetical protein VGK28_01910 [Candidatus Dormibacteraeota bacterium]